MVGEIIDLDGKNFDKFAKEGNLVVDFYADWCGPCKIMEPVFKKAGKELKNAKFGKVNVDNNYELAGRFQVVSIPTTIFFKKGEQVDRFSGAISFDELKKKIDENFR